MWYLALLTLSLAYLLSGHNFGLDVLSGYNAKRLLLCLLLVVGALSIFHPGMRERALTRIANLSRGARAALFIVLVAGVVSAIFAEHSMIALQEVWLFVLVFWAIVAASGRVEDEPLFIGLTVLACAIVIYWTGFVFELWAMLPISEARTMYAIFGYANPRFANQVQAWLFPLLLYFWLVEANGPRRIWVWVGRASTGLYASVMFVSAGRGILLALALSCVMMLFLGAQGRRVLRAMAFALATGLVIYAVTVQLPYHFIHGSPGGETAVSRVADGTMSRDVQWKVAVGGLRDHPLTGVGPQHYTTLYPGSHPHNSVLQFLAEWGLVGGMALTGLLAGAGIYAFRLARRRAGSASPGGSVEALLAMSVSTGLWYSLVSGVFVMPQSQLAFILVIAVLLGRSSGASRIPTHGSRFTRSVVVVSVLAAAAGLSWTAATDMTQRPHLLDPGDYRAYPRFWVNGVWHRPAAEVNESSNASSDSSS